MNEPNWDLLIVGGTILTMEPDTEPIVDGAIAVAALEALNARIRQLEAQIAQRAKEDETCRS